MMVREMKNIQTMIIMKKNIKLEKRDGYVFVCSCAPVRVNKVDGIVSNKNIQNILRSVADKQCLMASG